MELNNLPREKWKWIPDQEGYYKISCFGRVKRESFEVMMKNGVRRTVQEKIISTDLQKFPNKYTRDDAFHLRVKIMRAGIKYEVSIARITYYCFKRKFDLGNMDLMAIALDGDGRNIRLDNIALFNRNQKQKRIYERKRFKKPVTYSFDEYIEGLKKSANPNCRQVSQYTTDGKKVKTYLSIKAAALSLSISESGINSSAKGRQVSSGGFIWRYGSRSRINLKPFLDERVIHRKELRGTRVSQYSSNGKLLATFLTIADAGKSAGINGSDISENINGITYSAGGYIWKRGWGKKKILVPPNSFGEGLRARARWKPVKQYSLQGKYIQTFESVKAAARAINRLPAAISGALKRKTKIASGFKWRLKKL